MKEYEVKLRAVFAWCMACEWSVIDLAMLFRRVQMVVEYWYKWRTSEDFAVRATLQESHDAAFLDLSEFMFARCMPEEIRKCVWWIVTNHKERIDARH